MKWYYWVTIVTLIPLWYAIVCAIANAIVTVIIFVIKKVSKILKQDGFF